MASCGFAVQLENVVVLWRKDRGGRGVKKIIAIFLTVIMLVGCSSGVSQAEYDKLKTDYDAVVAERDELERSQGGVSQANAFSSPPTINQEIVFDKSNTATIMIFENENPIRGNVICSFDGKSAETEYARIVAFMYFFDQMKIGDYLVAAMVSDDEAQATAIMFKGGEAQVAPMIAERYKKLFESGGSDEANKLALVEYQEILEQLGEKTNNTVNEGKTDEQPTKSQENVLIHDDQYVTIKYVGCKKGDFGDELFFDVENKTEVELTFQCDAFAFDGENIKNISGSDGIAAKSRGEIHYRARDGLPTLTPQSITGTIRVIDFSEEIQLTDGKRSYNIKFVNVNTQ